LYITLENDEYWLSGQTNDGNASMEINYCPICGRKLAFDGITMEEARGECNK